MNSCEDISPTQSTPPRHTIFRGPNGIRAGWRALIFFAIAGALILVISVALRFLLPGKTGAGSHVSGVTPLALCLIEGSLLFFTAVPALIMAKIENRKWDQYGLPLRSAFGKDFWIGTGIGFGTISVTLLAMFAFHGFRLTGLATQGSTIVSSLLAWSGTFVLVGLAEEFAFRGYIQFTLTTGVGFWWSAIVLSIVFALAHGGNSGESIVGLLDIVPFGLLLCLFLRRTGNLWLAVGFHAGYDWGETFFYGVPDSGQAPYHNLFNSELSGSRWLTGGTVGPEGSLITPIVLAIVAILFVRAYASAGSTTNSGNGPRY